MSQTVVTPWKNGYYRYKSTTLWVVKVCKQEGTWPKAIAEILTVLFVGSEF